MGVSPATTAKTFGRIVDSRNHPGDLAGHVKLSRQLSLRRLCVETAGRKPGTGVPSRLCPSRRKAGE